MKFDILSLFPDYFRGPFNVSIVGRAVEKGLIDIHLTDIRDFALDKYAKVDDRPYGGGPGMVLMPGPVAAAIRHVKSANAHVVYLTPQGTKLTAKKCEELAKKDHVVLLCGHYEGVDERVIAKEVDEEISIGDFVLTSGCSAAIVVVDAVCRFIPGVLGNEESGVQDSFQEGIFDSPHYTRPVEFEGMVVPQVLQSGNHAEIKKWREGAAREKTARVRPDILCCCKENEQ